MMRSSHNKQISATSPRLTFAADALFCAAVTAVLYLRFFRWPNIPIDPVVGDQSMFLWGGQRILEGQTIYRDFFQFTTPGTEFVYAALIKFFGPTAMLAKMTTLAVGSALCILGLYISRKVIAGGIAYAVPLLFLTAAYLPLPDATHHAFSALAALCGIAFLLAETDRESGSQLLWAAAGACFGAASFFTTARGLLGVAAIGALLAMQRSLNMVDRAEARKKAGAVTLGFAATLGCLLAPVIWQAGMPNVYECIVRFPLEHYRTTPQTNMRAYGIDLPIRGFASAAPYSLRDIGGILGLCRWALIYFISPGIYLLAAYRLWQAWAEIDDREKEKVMLLIAAGVGFFVSAAYSPNHFRMGMVSIPAIVLLLWRLTFEKRIVLQVAAFALGLFAAATVPAGVLHSQSKTGIALETPSGNIVIAAPPDDARTQKYLWLKAHTHPGDFFLTPDHLEYDYLFHLNHPGPVPYLSIYDYTTPPQVEETIAALQQHHVRYVFWPLDVQKVTVNTEGAPPAGDHLKPLRRYRKDNYSLILRFNDFEEVWERKSD